MCHLLVLTHPLLCWYCFWGMGHSEHEAMVGERYQCEPIEKMLITASHRLSLEFAPLYRDPYRNKTGITVDDLKIFETVEEITGALEIEPEDKLPELKSLDMFRNLKRVGGAGVGTR